MERETTDLQIKVVTTDRSNVIKQMYTSTAVHSPRPRSVNKPGDAGVSTAMEDCIAPSSSCASTLDLEEEESGPDGKQKIKAFEMNIIQRK